MKQVKDVDEYISMFPQNVQEMLSSMRETILKTAPGSIEAISYGMPAYKNNGVLVYFAGYTKHIGFYPSTSGISEFKKELSVFKGAKGSVQFPLDKPLPLALVKKIVKYRVAENLQKAKNKKK